MTPEKMKRPPAQAQDHQPGKTAEMEPTPEDKMSRYKAAGKLTGRRAIVTGGDSGIGRAVAIGFAKEGADVGIVYLEEDKDADVTREHIEKEGRKCVAIRGDIGSRPFCDETIERLVDELGGLDILVNNAGEQHMCQSLEEISDEQLERTFRTNIFSQFYLTRAALRHMKKGASIICTTSITAYAGSPHLIDYSSTKGAIATFIRSLSGNLAEKGIRVNGVAPGPVWTPLIPASFPAEKVAKFSDTPLGRPGQPDEIAPAYIYLASDDSTFTTGQVIHANGGRIING